MIELGDVVSGVQKFSRITEYTMTVDLAWLQARVDSAQVVLDKAKKDLADAKLLVG